MHLPQNPSEDLFDVNPHIEKEWWVEPGIAHPDLITGEGNLVQVFHDLHKKDHRKWANYALYLGWFHSPSLRLGSPKEWVEDAAKRAGLINRVSDLAKKKPKEIDGFLCQDPRCVSWRYLYKVLGYQMHYAFQRVVTMGLTYEQLRREIEANMSNLVNKNPRHLAESMRILTEDIDALMEKQQALFYMQVHKGDVEENLMILRESDSFSGAADSKYVGIEEEEFGE